MSRCHSLAVALACASAVALGTVAPATASPGNDPASLTRGAAPQVTWLAGLTIHTGSGRQYPVPLPADRAPYLRLLGRAHHSWVVADLGAKQAAASRVLRVHRGRYRTLLSVQNYYDRPTYQLARHGDELATWDYDRGGTTASVYSWGGRLLGRRSSEAFSQLLDFRGDQVIYADRKVARWTAGSPPVPVAKSGLMADVDHDLLFVATGKNVGPTSLTHPGPPTWAARFAPRAVSPDGAWVAGYAYDSIFGKRRELEIRSMADGSLQPSAGLQLPPNAALGWEDSDHLLAEVHGVRGNALVRCRVDGQCERATPWLGSAAVSLPHQVEYFFDWP